MKKFSILYAFFYTLLTFASCTNATKKDLEVKVIPLTESESIYFIQKADTIECKCYIVTEDGDKINIKTPYSIDNLMNGKQNLSVHPIAQKQRGYRETLQEIRACLKVVSSKYLDKNTIDLHCDLTDFSDIAITVSQHLPEHECKNNTQIEDCITHTTLAADLTAMLREYNMSVKSVSLDSEAKCIYMDKDLFLSNHIIFIKNIPQKILAAPIKISIVETIF